jgi:hypothetical protein
VEEACKCDEGLEHEVVEGRYRPARRQRARRRSRCATGASPGEPLPNPSPSLPSSSSSTSSKPPSAPGSPSSMKSCVERRQGIDPMRSDERAERRAGTPHCRCQPTGAPKNDVFAMTDPLSVPEEATPRGDLRVSHGGEVGSSSRAISVTQCL